MSSTPSKDLPPLPERFTPVFIRNQFRTTIPLPDRTLYPHGAVGQRAIVTGANSGLGLAAADELLALGLAHLVMAVRSPDGAATFAAAARLRAAYPAATIDVWALDMLSSTSIRTFAQRCHDDLPGRIDLVLLNAGISPLAYATAANGHESAIQVNHYGTALLAVLLLPVLREKALASQRGSATPPPPPPHLTVVNSVMAHLCKLPHRTDRPLLASFDGTATSFDPTEQYGASKLMSQLFFVRLAAEVAPVRGAPILNMVDPGLTKGTRLGRDARGLVGVVYRAFFQAAGRPVERGAATYVDAVLGHGTESHGCFLMNCAVAPLSKWYYNDKKLVDVVWEETMRDAAFAGARELVQSMAQ